MRFFSVHVVWLSSNTSKRLGSRVHVGFTYLCIERNERLDPYGSPYRSHDNIMDSIFFCLASFPANQR